MALEALVLADPDLDVQIPGLGPVLACVPGTRDPDPLAVLDPGRDVDVPGPAAADASRAVAFVAGLIGDLALTVAGRAGGRPDHLAERRA